MKLLFLIFRDSEFFEIYGDGRMEKYEMWNKVFGYSGIVFYTLVAQFLLWWINWDLEVGIVITAFHHLLSMVSSWLFIFQVNQKYACASSRFVDFVTPVLIMLSAVPAGILSSSAAVWMAHSYFSIYLFVFLFDIRAIINDNLLYISDKDQIFKKEEEKTKHPKKTFLNKKNVFVLSPNTLYKKL
ncbi:hypothetical protein GCK72_007101 [Caenorhabditis remanei]|uniref:Uncharacterized protein n=1 Tax=Caenorhabditis remanei TaxID=31234 RepID=A0A6A5HMX1_CAERE|nr:hypothetical protein GCK72_007101 [Caenorhabditis remanei]KAF1767142.1 hypothetical protein GCK72_007101 [Caenorhabditis remanei]